MRWWSRNWPDVIIVFLILVLIAGFVLVLRGGLHQAAPGQAAGSPAGATPRQAPAQRTSPLAVSPATATPSASPPAAASTAPGASSTPSAPNAVPTIPAQQAQPSQATSSSSEAKTSRRRSGPASPAPQPVAGRAPSPKSLISAHHPPTGADYRISAGVFRIHGDARRMAAAVEKTGFPAYILTSSGHQYAVLTGPFATRAAAEQALKELKVATPNLFIYAPNPGSSSPAASAFCFAVGRFIRIFSAFCFICSLKLSGIGLVGPALG